MNLAAEIAEIVGDPTPVVIGDPITAGATRSTYRVRLAGDALAIAQISTPRDAGDEGLPADVEAKLVALTARVGVPVVDIIGCGELRDGSTVVVSKELIAESIPRKVLRLVESETGLSTCVTDQVGSALARLHDQALRAVTTEIFPQVSLDTLTTNYLDDLTRKLDESPWPLPVLRFGVEWLRDQLAPHLDELSVVHGDFRLGNWLVDSDGLRAVIDWEFAHIGDPMEDLAWTCLRTWRFGNHGREFAGLATEAELIEAYERAGGVFRRGAFEWWTVARTLWWGIGLASQAAAWERGDSNSIVHAASGRRVVELEYDLLRLIEAQDSTN